MTATIELIKELRQATGAGVQECRKALEQSGADYARAQALLHEQALVAAARRAERPVFQGRIELYSHNQGRIGVMVEICAETDFASRSETFRAFAHTIALQIAAAAPLYVSEEDIPSEALAGEAEQAAEGPRRLGKPEAIVARIVEGRLQKFKDETELLRQASIWDETVTVAQLLNQACASLRENICVRRFLRWELNEQD